MGEGVKAKNENCLMRAHARGNKERTQSRAGGPTTRLREEEEPDGPADAALWYGFGKRFVVCLV